MSNTIKFFYEIAKIPRGSGNETKMSEYLCDFARKRNLKFRRDENNNVIIKKKTSKGTPIILQAHQDMVCTKKVEKKFDFSKDAIEVYEEDGYLTANGTTLGADNGIGVAQILNILDSDIKCNVEAIFTVEEETTMKGAESIDLMDIEAKQMICLDGFERDTVIIESAGFVDFILEHKYETEKSNKNNLFKIGLTGMKGGHSGFDINKNRGNSNIELAKMLKQVEDIEIQDFKGGDKSNVIPSSAKCIFLSDLDKEKLEKITAEYEKTSEFENISLKVEKLEEHKKEALNNENSLKYLNTILKFKNGIYSQNDKGEVTTSMNLGIVNFKEKMFWIGMRSSRENEKEECLKSVKQYASENNLKYKFIGSQPGFQTRENSEFVNKLVDSYNKVIKGKEVIVKPVHFSVEAGIFANKIKGLQVAIISPEIQNAHSTSEKVNIESIIECDKWLKEILKNK